MPADADDAIRRYLLGQLDDAARAAFEERLFAGDEALDAELQAAENDLVDDYVRGRLARSERSRFEQALPALPSRRARVAFARGLARAARPGIPVWNGRALRGWGLSLAAAAVVVFVARGPAAPPPRDAPLAEPHPSPAAGIGAAPPAVALEPTSTVRVVLLAGVLRSRAAAPSVVVGPEIDTVELQVFVESDGPLPAGCRARLTHASGGEAWAADVTLVSGPEGVFARLPVPAATLVADDYLVTLAAAGTPSDEIAGYALRVVR